jgi:hypothetical protein
VDQVVADQRCSLCCAFERLAMAHAALLVEHSGEGVVTRCPAEREDASDDGDTQDGETARQDEYDPSS